MRKLLIFLAIVIVIAAAVGAWALTHKDTSTKVDVKKTAQANKPKVSNDAGLRPEPGTYSYSGSGSETVDLLGGSKHTFPKTYPSVIKLQKGCNWSQDILVLKESETLEHMCTDESGVREVSYDNTLTFLGITQVDTYDCAKDEDAYRVRQPVKDGDSWKWTCTAKDSDYVRKAQVVGAAESVQVDGKTVDTVHVRIDSHLTRDKSGTSHYDYWQLPTGLTVRYKVTRDYVSPTALGKTKYHQSLDYTIDSLTPQ